jgi:hypothetical protein
MTSHIEQDYPVSGDVALTRLLDGNARFIRGEPTLAHPPQDVLANLDLPPFTVPIKSGSPGSRVIDLSLS